MISKITIYYFTLPHYRLSLFKKLVGSGGAHLRIIYPARREGDSITGLEKRERFEQFSELLSLPKKILLGGGASSFFYTQGVLKAAKDYTHDVFVIQGSIYDISSVALMLYLRIVGRPFVFWNKGFAGDSRRSGFLVNLVLWMFYRLPRSVLTYGDSSNSYFYKYGVPFRNVFTGYNTVDVLELARRRDEYRTKGLCYFATRGIRTDGCLVVGTVGRLTSKKRVEDLVRAVAILRRAGVDAVCLIGGNGECFSELQSIAVFEGVASHVHFLGVVPENYDNYILSALSIAVFCGGLGLAINQSMALSVPVVCCEELGSDSEMVVHGKTGYRYRKGDPAALAEALRFIGHDPDRNQIISQAHFEITERRNEERYVERFHRVIEHEMYLTGRCTVSVV